MKRIAFWAIILFLLTGCKASGRNDDKITFTIEPQKQQPYIPFSTVFDSINYIPLETTSESAFMYIDKFELFDNRFIIWDRGTNALYIFTRAGKFLAKISDKSAGLKKSFETIYDFSLDKKNKQIIIKDANRGVFVYFSLEGVKIKEQAYPFAFARFEILENGSYIFYMRYSGSERHNLIITDSNMNVQQRLQPFTSSLKTGSALFDPDQVFFRYKDTVFVSYTYGRQILKISKQGTIKHLEIAYPSQYQVPEAFLNPAIDYNAVEQLLVTEKGKHLIWNITDIFKTDNGVFTFRILSMNEVENIIFYNSLNGNYVLRKFVGSDKHSGYLPFLGKRIIGADEHSFYTAVSSRDLITQHVYLQNEGIRIHESIKKKLTNITRLSNPVIVQIMPKSF